MIEALLLTICICGGASAIAFLKADHDYNRKMQEIFGDEHEFSLLDTPWLS